MLTAGRHMNEISEVTRRSIIDFLSSISWSGRLQEDEFLSRLYDLTKMKSTDGRYKNAAGDIRQHRVYNNDWSDGWVFTDERFNILWASDDEFLKFLCETVHPIVRSNEQDAQKMVEIYNKYLKPDGWELFQKDTISGRSVYGAKKVDSRISIIEEPTGWEKVDR